MTYINRAPVRCGIVLAAGAGKRLQPFIYHLRGDALPKQYVRLIGTRSMLEHTFQRAESLIPPARLFTVVSREHLSHPEVRQQLSSRPAETVIVQPMNKETGPGILLPLVHVFRRYPESTVVVFPSDHFIGEEQIFMDHVAMAFTAVERNPSCVVLLGIQPTEAETEYGYILPGREVYPRLWKVSRFIEKPDACTALKLIQNDGLWNTMVMIFNAGSMMDLVCGAAPKMHAIFGRILDAVGTPGELKAVEEGYHSLESMNFSKGLLQPFSLGRAARLMVLPVRGVRWSDWGSEQRIISVLRDIGRLGRLERIPKPCSPGLEKDLAVKPATPNPGL